MIDASALRMLLLTVTGWLDRREMLAYLIEENRVLRRQLGGGACASPMMTGGNLPNGPTGWAGARCRGRDDRHAGHAAPMARQLIARKWTYAKTGTRRRDVLAEIRQLVGRLADENPMRGYTRIQGAVATKNSIWQIRTAPVPAGNGAPGNGGDADARRYEPGDGRQDGWRSPVASLIVIVQR